MNIPSVPSDLSIVWVGVETARLVWSTPVLTEVGPDGSCDAEPRLVLAHGCGLAVEDDAARVARLGTPIPTTRGGRVGRSSEPLTPEQMRAAVRPRFTGSMRSCPTVTSAERRQRRL